MHFQMKNTPRNVFYNVNSLLQKSIHQLFLLFFITLFINKVIKSSFNTLLVN